MYKIIIFSDTFKHFEVPIKEYEKRLWKWIEVICLKPSKKNNPMEVIEEETRVMKERLQKLKGYKILLDIQWNYISTEKFSELVEKNKTTFSQIVFIVGWAYGLKREEIENLIDYKLSFSPMTFPHSMAFLMLIEQIYRIEMIRKWSGYHHV